MGNQGGPEYNTNPNGPYNAPNPNDFNEERKEGDGEGGVFKDGYMAGLKEGAKGAYKGVYKGAQGAYNKVTGKKP